jgi:SpoIID/LytB domain protein
MARRLTTTCTALAVAATTLLVAPAASAAAPAGGTLAAATPTSASAGDVYVWPSGGSPTINGRGYGHGHGLSQWGALGGARQGNDYKAILKHYYADSGGKITYGTATGDIRVLSTGSGSTATTVAAESGLSITAAGGAKVTLPTTVAGASGKVTQWRLVRSGTTLALQAHAGNGSTSAASAWTTYTGAGATLASPAVFAATDGTVTEVQPNQRRDHRGKVQGTVQGTSVKTVVLLPLESYLRSVVPSEMPSSWDAAALQSQAVAARTYAAFEVAANAGRYYDICDTTACQVYASSSTTSGDVTTKHEASTTDAAIAATKGVIVTYGGKPAFTQFSASNGGWETDGGQPYLLGRSDPWDGYVANSAHSWTDIIKRSTIEAAYPSLGTLTGLEIVSRDHHGTWGGRTTSVRLIGTKSSQTVTGETLRSVAKLKGSWWQPFVSRAPGSARDYDGDGYPDLLATDTSGALWLYSGNGAGGFLGSAKVADGWQGVTLVPVGDLDGDDRADIVAFTPDGVLWLYAGTGKGTFKPRVQIGHGWKSVRALTGVGDLDGDGNDDLVATFTDGTLWLFPGTDAGWFRPKRPIGHGWAKVDTLVGTGDFDGDGNVDVIARETTGRIWLYRGNGRGWFGRVDPIGTGWGGLRLVSPGDWSGDGWPDLLAVYADGTMRLFPGNGKGWFGTSIVVSTGWDSYPQFA